MSDVRNKLASLLNTPGLMKGADWQEKLETLRLERETGEYEVDKVVRGEVVGDPERGFFLAQGDISAGYAAGRH